MPLIHTQSFTHLYKHTVQIDVRAYAHTLPLELSLSLTHRLAHPHTHSHILLHVNIVDEPLLNLSVHTLLWPYFWQTDNEE